MSMNQRQYREERQQFCEATIAEIESKIGTLLGFISNTSTTSMDKGESKTIIRLLRARKDLLGEHTARQALMDSE